jgi:metallophosphoesterase (TIGR00282 family)
LRLLFLGDVVGRSGRNVVAEQLPGLIERFRLDFVIVNGENAAGGFGITEEIFQGLLDAGADVVTTGNHVFDQKEALVFADRQERFLRPINYPPGTPGRGSGVYAARNGGQVVVINAMGRLFMDALDDPFAAIERELASSPLGDNADALVIDFHAEATSEKQAAGLFADGRASLVVGTHTHVPTADYRILAGGTAYISDAGMCGDYDSVLGMERDEPIHRFLHKYSTGRLSAATGPGALSGVAVEIADDSGLATAIAPLRLGPGIAEAMPPFWLD